jgi:hypothetical protein
MTTTATRRAAITLRALTQRINRRLEEHAKAVRSPRGRGDTRRGDLGDYFIVNTASGQILEHHITVKGLEKMARELKAIHAWEEVEQ